MNLSPVPLHPSSRAIRPPALVPYWYMVCPGRELRPGGIRRFDLGGEPIVLFRGKHDRTVRAIPGHCVHQGADLGHGSVVGDRLVCPLHRWEYSDRCERIPGLRPRYRTAERYGMLFVHLGAEPPAPIPGFSVDDAALYFRAGKPVAIDCPWYVTVANAFDMTHLETVHQRELQGTPAISHPAPLTFRIRYATRVTGTGLSDRLMRALSRNDVRVEVTSSGGTVLQVESTVGRRRAYLFVSLRPTRTGVSILPIFGVPRRASGSHRLHARISAALFTAFLRRDVKPLSGIRFPDEFVDGVDETINACYRYLCELPDYAVEERT